VTTYLELPYTSPLKYQVTPPFELLEYHFDQTIVTKL
jgi:hypothetical protein